MELSEQTCGGNLQLRHYQRKPAQWMLDHPEQKGLYIAYSTGAGKTYALVETIVAMRQSGVITKVIAITPAKLKRNLKVSLLRCLSTDPESELPDWITIDSFEGVQKRKLRINDKTMLVVDEAHKLRNSSTTRYHKILSMANRAGKVILMSATPAMTRLENLNPQYNLMVPKAERIALNTKWSDDKGQLQNVDMLFALWRGKIAFYDLTGTEEDTRPKVRYHKVLVPMTDQQARMLKAILHEYKIDNKQELKAALGENTTGNPQSNAFMNKVRRFANAGSYQECDSPKIQKAIQLLKDAKGPSMLYSWWLDMGTHLVLRCMSDPKWNIAPEQVGVIDGSLSERKLTDLMEKYNVTHEVRHLLLSAAAQEGLNTKLTDTFVVLEPQWQKLAEDQAIARAVRMDSHPPGSVVNVYYLCSHNVKDELLNIDELMFDLNRKKFQSIDQISAIFQQASIPLASKAKEPVKRLDKSVLNKIPKLPPVKLLDETSPGVLTRLRRN